MNPNHFSPLLLGDYFRVASYAEAIPGDLIPPLLSNQNEELCARRLRTMSMRLLVLLGAASLCSCPTIAQPDRALGEQPCGSFSPLANRYFFLTSIHAP